MTVFIQQVDLTEDSRVLVSGHLARTHLVASLAPRVYIHPPQDGVWDYDLDVNPTAPFGGCMLMPFCAYAEAPVATNVNGIRIWFSQGGSLKSTTLLKAKRVSAYSSAQKNGLWITGGAYIHDSRRLVLDIRYSGGCFPHAFALEWDGTVEESVPSRYTMQIFDLSKYDPCKAFIDEQLLFDLNTADVDIPKGSVVVVRPRFGRHVEIKT